MSDPWNSENSVHSASSAAPAAESSAAESSWSAQPQSPSDQQGASGHNASVEAQLHEIYEAHTEGEGSHPRSTEQQAVAGRHTEPQQGQESQQPGAEQQGSEGAHKADTAPNAEAAEAATATEDAGAMEPPVSWTKAEKEAWSAAPAEVRQALVRRAQQVENYGKQVGQELAAARSFSESMRPIGEALVEMRPHLEGLAGPDGGPLWGNAAAIGQELKDLTGMKAQFMRDPVAGLRGIVEWGRRQGYDMADALAHLVKDAHGWQDSTVVRAQAQAEQQSQRAHYFQRQHEQYQQAQAHQQQVAYVEQQVTSLADMRDSEGQAHYPHLHGEHAEEVGELAGRYIRANVQHHGGLTSQLFQEAYNAAIWSHPAVRAQEQARLENARVAQFKTHSQRARRAAGLVPSSSGTGMPRVETMTPMEAMESVWSRHQGA